MKCVCNFCGTVVEVPTEAGGRQVTCGHCRRTFSVPESFALSEDEIMHILVEPPPIDEPTAERLASSLPPEDQDRVHRVWQTALENAQPGPDGQRHLVISFRFSWLPPAKAFVKTLPFIRVVDKRTGQVAYPSRIVLEVVAFKSGGARVTLRGRFTDIEIKAVRAAAPKHGAHLEGLGW